MYMTLRVLQRVLRCSLYPYLLLTTIGAEALSAQTRPIPSAVVTIPAPLPRDTAGKSVPRMVVRRSFVAHTASLTLDNQAVLSPQRTRTRGGRNVVIGALVGGVVTAAYFRHRCVVDECYVWVGAVPLVALGAGAGALVGLLLTPSGHE